MRIPTLKVACAIAVLIVPFLLPVCSNSRVEEQNGVLRDFLSDMIAELENPLEDFPLDFTKIASNRAPQPRILMGGDSKNDENLNLTQAVIEVATLGVIANSLNLASGPIAIVRDSLATLAAVINIPIADFTRQTSRLQWHLSVFDFGQTLWKGENKVFDGSDYLGDAAKYVRIYSNIQKALNTGSLKADMTANMQQLVKANEFLQAAQVN